jgi:enamine deaminase RidA (YjgF/YER057c/UK114 family)
MTVEERLQAAGMELPRPVEGVADAGGVRPNIVLSRRVGDIVYLSGTGPLRDGEFVYRGKLGADMSIEDGYAAARLTGLNLVANLAREIGDLERVTRWVKALGLVNSTPDFEQQPAVINGFSDLIIELFGQERGAHARSAIGVAALPHGIPVEIEAIVEVR